MMIVLLIISILV
ncbi:MAG: hypothetical protein L0L78_05685, partial [Tetragenococcus koreensis]|nr:hypothetical protein [Tetragenococcus koreensis]